MNYNIITYILKNLHSDITIEKLSEDLDCSISTCARLIDYKNPYKRSPNSIKHDTYLNTFLKYKKEYFQDSSEYAIITIIKILKNINYDISEIELKLISPLENYDYISFVGFLLKKASDFYKFSTNNGFNVYSSTEKESIKFNTYFDLRNQGLSAKDMILQLIKNNYTLYKDSEEHAGSIEQWMEHLTTHPENWGFLCIGNKIIGNYSFIFLTKKQEESIMKGTYLENQLTLSNSADIHEYQTDEQVIYLLNMSINDGYQTIANHDMLWTYFGKRLQQLTTSGIFYKGIYTLVKRLDHQKTFRKMGFEFLVDNYYKGSVYYLNLMKKHLDPISWIMPEEPLNDNVIFKQLSYKDILTNQQLIDIASLIWDDDDYISEPYGPGKWFHSEGPYDDYYNFERGITVDDCSTDDGACPRATTWTGKIGLMYPSDYVYATDQNLCTTDAYDWDTDTNCTSNDWLYNSSLSQWTISPRSGFAYYVFSVRSTGSVINYHAYTALGARPVAYLRSDVTLNGGEGTSSNPYTLSSN